MKRKGQVAGKSTDTAAASRTKEIVEDKTESPSESDDDDDDDDDDDEGVTSSDDEQETASRAKRETTDFQSNARKYEDGDDDDDDDDELLVKKAGSEKHVALPDSDKALVEPPQSQVLCDTIVSLMIQRSHLIILF